MPSAPHSEGKLLTDQCVCVCGHIVWPTKYPYLVEMAGHRMVLGTGVWQGLGTEGGWGCGPCGRMMADEVDNKPGRR